MASRYFAAMVFPGRTLAFEASSAGFGRVGHALCGVELASAQRSNFLIVGSFDSFPCDSSGFLKNFGAEEGIRTPTPYGATPSRWCVCQFRHFRTR